MRDCTFIGLFSVTALGLFAIGCGAPEASTTSGQSASDAESVSVTTVSFANDACPLMSGAPKADLIRQWNDKTIGFCCDGCPEEWDALSEEEKAEKFAAVAAAAAEGHDHAAHDHAEHDHEGHEHGSLQSDEQGEHAADGHGLGA